MKYLFVILCTSTLIYAASDELVEPTIESIHQQEIGFLEANEMVHQPVLLGEIQMPIPIIESKFKSPALAVSLSILFPGLGHFYLGDLKTASGLMSSFGGGLGASFYSNTTSIGIETAFTTMMYGLYAAYRDARTYNSSSYYLHKMPTDSLGDLALAPFKWSVLKKPEVWGGILGSLALAIGVVALIDDSGNVSDQTQSVWQKCYPLLAFSTGVSEEALFRGFLQSGLSEFFEPLGGIFLSSLAFGAAHISIGKSADVNVSHYKYTIPLRIFKGVFYGWLTYKNHSLKESVAVHSWFDFILMGLSTWADSSDRIGERHFVVTIPF